MNKHDLPNEEGNIMKQLDRTQLEKVTGGIGIKQEIIKLQPVFDRLALESRCIALHKQVFFDETAQ